MISIRILQTPLAWAILLVGVVILACGNIWKQKRRIQSSPQLYTSNSGHLKEANPKFTEASYYQTDTLDDLDLENEEPLKIRPFKAKYHLTMAIETIPASDLIAMDKTYASRIQLRRQLIKDHHDEVLVWNPVVTPAVLEMYSYLINVYLPRRFPTVFTISSSGLRNHITGEILPLHPSSTEETLHILGGNIDNDFLFLLPIEDGDAGEDKGKYRLEGFITCFPSGFATREKLGLKLSDIHSPVPGYAAKLEKSMDRFFASLPAGKIVRRHNWSITTDDRLFATSGNHMSESELASKSKSRVKEAEEEEEKIDLRRTNMRCERQTLHRLPKTGALVFAFKTFLYPVEELRDEGCGEELAVAIDGLGEGSVPGMTVYKRQVVWGEKVKRFLRGEIGVDD